MNRRDLLTGLSTAALLCGLSPAHAGTGATTARLGMPRRFAPDLVLARARALAAQPYKPRPKVPAAWQQLSYPQYRDIRFDTDRAIWSDTDSPARLDLFAPGLYFPHAVTVHTVENNASREIKFDPSLFQMGANVPDLPFPADLGFSGLRLRGSFLHEGFGEEFLVLQGASYFRSLGIGQAYGLSARGLAINTGGPEEFPDFTEFWVERPESDDATTIIHALMDSPSVTGAYRMTVTPGATTTMHVSATLFPRRDIADGGIAPLTSMFLFDGTNRDRFSDFRPAVHDSEGLAMFNGAGERLWRPLANPKQLQISAFRDTGPKGFGLMQRHRAFDDFADLEAHYHRRPSLWVTPDEDWGAGHVMLVEIPADQEIYDNIVAFWRPDAPMRVGEETRLSYRLDWGDQVAPASDLVNVHETRMGNDPFGQGITVAIDFEPGIAVSELDGLDAHASTSAGEIKGVIVQRNPQTGGPRLAFHFDPGQAPLTELRAGLLRDGKPVSETWMYRWTV